MRLLKILKILGIACLIALALAGSFFLADYLRGNDAARRLVEQFGYVGILVVSVIAGLNLFIPIPAATFTPIYVSAGFPLPVIIAILTIGTLIADTIGYLIGIGGRHVARHAHPKFEERIRAFAYVHPRLVTPLVFLSSAFAPFPNEVVLIPLAFIGIRFRILFLPLLAGTVVYNTLIAYGLTSTFEYFF